MNHGQKPIDNEPMPPPQAGTDPNSVTRNIEAALERAVTKLIDAEVESKGVGRRHAALVVLLRLDPAARAQLKDLA